MHPDASKHDPRPDYLRALVDQSGLAILLTLLALAQLVALWLVMP